jgi:hypothetical protein
MNNPRGIHLPVQVWSNLQLHAEITNSLPSKGTKRNIPSITTFLRRIGEDSDLLQAISDYLNQPKAQQAFSAAMTVIRPMNAKTETIAKIIIDDDVLDVLIVSFSEKRDDFRDVIKKLGFRWKDDHWQRTIKPLNGLMTDRAAQTGHQLLAAGFCVILPNKSIQAQAITGNYQPEVTRWITRVTLKNQPYFCPTWHRDDDLYHQAMRMTGAKYQDSCVTVPFEHFAEIEDFAALHQFSFTDAANELLAIAKQIRQNAITVDVTVKSEDKPDFERPVLSIPDDVQVDHELLDD